VLVNALVFGYILFWNELTALSILLFVLLPFFRWPLHCLSIDVWPLITPLVSANSSYLTLELKIDLIGIQNNKCYIDRWATQEL
jgi:hypothetical protein